MGGNAEWPFELGVWPFPATPPWCQARSPDVPQVTAGGPMVFATGDLHRFPAPNGRFDGDGFDGCFSPGGPMADGRRVDQRTCFTFPSLSFGKLFPAGHRRRP